MQSRRRILQLSLLVLAACSGGDEDHSTSAADAGSEEQDATVDAPDSSEGDEPDQPTDTVVDGSQDVVSDDAMDAASAVAIVDAAMVDAASDATVDAAFDFVSAFGCANRQNNTPDTLQCTGLYSSLVMKQVASNVREFKPAEKLWSNGADKRRWIYLPPGTTIDASNPREWVFPVGTKFWKEFSVGGRRIETRFLNKIGTGNWLRGAYRWSDDEASAARYDSATAEVFKTPNGTDYHIPTPVQCDDCHNGRRDFVMGFESVLLGLDGAEGVTLEQLASEGLLSPAPATTHYSLASAGDDPAKALAWLHVNCGVSCHNSNPKSKANSFNMHLRLDPDQLAAGGAPDATWDVISSTLNVAGKSKTGAGGVRIVPHEPDASLIIQLISGSPTMPYLDTVQVNTPDTADVAFVRSWIGGMAANPDNGVPDSGTRDAGSDAGRGDGGMGFGDGGRDSGGPNLGDAGSDAGEAGTDTGDAGPNAGDAGSSQDDGDAASDDGCVPDLDGACQQ